MRPQIFILLCIVVCVKSQTFGTCSASVPCPPNASCVSSTCQCAPGFSPYDTGVEVGGNPVTFCARFPCTTADPNPCSGNGECVVVDGQFKCLCYDGFYGDTCQSTTTTSTTMMTTSTTERNGYGGILAIAGASVLALLVLGGGAAALASSTG